MNRYPIWKYVVIAVAIAFGLIYTLPNFFGESPAVQVSSAKATVKVDTAVLERVEQALSAAKIEQTGLQLECSRARSTPTRPIRSTWSRSTCCRPRRSG